MVIGRVYESAVYVVVVQESFSLLIVASEYITETRSQIPIIQLKPRTLMIFFNAKTAKKRKNRITQKYCRILVFHKTFQLEYMTIKHGEKT